MFARTARVVLATAALLALLATPAMAAPGPDASQIVGTGADVVIDVFESIDHVTVGAERTSIAFADSADPLEIEYGEVVAGTKKTGGVGAGHLAVGWIGLAFMTRITRLLRALGLGR